MSISDLLVRNNYDIYVGSISAENISPPDPGQPITIVGQLEVSGDNDPDKLTVKNNNGDVVFGVDTDAPKVDVGANIVPLPGEVVDIGTTARPFNNIISRGIQSNTWIMRRTQPSGTPGGAGGGFSTWANMNSGWSVTHYGVDPGAVTVGTSRFTWGVIGYFLITAYNIVYTNEPSKVAWTQEVPVNTRLIVGSSEAGNPTDTVNESRNYKSSLVGFFNNNNITNGYTLQCWRGTTGAGLDTALGAPTASGDIEVYSEIIVRQI